MYNIYYKYGSKAVAPILCKTFNNIRDGHQNLKLLLIDLNQMRLKGIVERNILVFKSFKSDGPLKKVMAFRV